MVYDKVTAANGQAFRARLVDDRWHFHHGPIDLIIDVDADDPARGQCIERCWVDFQRILPALVAELPALRRPASARATLHGDVAQRMLRACVPFADERFLTPMAAVAGSVADELIGAFEWPGVRRASINNGGDIAVHLAPGATYRVGIWSRLDRPVPLLVPIPARVPRPMGAHVDLDGVFTLRHAMPVRGVATSGWRGRSFSLGIADSVTVLAHNAAAADAAATLIANAVNIERENIVRLPAEDLKDDSDLGRLLVTVDVPALPVEALREALARGRLEAQRWLDRDLIHAAALFAQGEMEVVLPRGVGISSAVPQFERALA